MEALEKKVLQRSFAAALFAEVFLLFLLGWHFDWRASNKTADQSNFIEAQVYEPPREAKLVDVKKIVSVPEKKEAVLSKVPDLGRKAPPSEHPLEEKNQTNAGQPLLANHGPIVYFSPPPIIPEYLRDQNLKTSVVIEFAVAHTGEITPRLISASGNAELDAIALKAVKQWRFHPAEQERVPIDAKLRLRIVFEVR